MTLDWNNHVVHLNDAHGVLATFGITEPTRAYERWVRPNGFRLADFWDVLGDSPFIVTMDWRGMLDDFVEEVLPALAQLGVELSYGSDGSGNAGVLTAGDGRKEPVRYVPSAGDDFNRVIAAIQRLAGPGVEFRASPANEGSDGWTYAVLARDEWAALDSMHPEPVGALFAPLKR